MNDLKKSEKKVDQCQLHVFASDKLVKQWYKIIRNLECSIFQNLVMDQKFDRINSYNQMVLT